MAKAVNKNLSLVIDSNDLSSDVRSATLDTSFESIDLTTMGSDAMERLTGLQDYTLNATFAQDFATGQVDDDLWTTYDTGTAVTVTIKFDTAATSASNPAYSGSVIITDYTPISGAVGEGHECSITAVCAGGSKLARATS